MRQMMEDRYSRALIQIEVAKRNTLSIYEGEQSRFRTFIREIRGDVMSDNDYLKILEMFYMEYRQKKNANAQQYCILQMQRVLQHRKHAWMFSMFPLLGRSKEIDPLLLEFIRRKRPYYEHYSNRIEAKWVFFTTLVAIFFLALLVLAGKLPFLAVLVPVLILWLFSLFIIHRYIVPELMTEKITRLSKSLDLVHQEFEKAMKISAPSPFVFR